MESPLIQIEDLAVSLRTDRGEARAVDRLSLSIGRGETLGLVGESGCGKSMTALAILRLVPDPPARIAAGRLLFDGRDLLGLSERQMRAVRGDEIAMVFQEPMTSLNPVFTIGFQIMEAIRLHRSCSRKTAKKLAVESLGKVGMPDPEIKVDEHPHRLSGGMKQRAMIAMALCCEPRLLIADEPTTALDVTIQAQVLDLLRDRQRADGLSILLITHDLGVVAESADRVAVMYAGRIVEQAGVAELFERPLHPYTRGLFESLPSLGGRRGKLSVIRGQVPPLTELPEGCRFGDRCLLAQAELCSVEPELEEMGRGHQVACHLVDRERS